MIFLFYLEDILDAVNQIQLYTGGMGKEDFERDRKTQDAAIRNLEIIGEAAGRLPDTMIQKTAQIEWRKIRALRNIL